MKTYKLSELYENRKQICFDIDGDWSFNSALTVHNLRHARDNVDAFSHILRHYQWFSDNQKNSIPTLENLKREDLSPWFVWIFENAFLFAPEKFAIRQVLDLHKRVVNGETPSIDEWWETFNMCEMFARYSSQQEAIYGNAFTIDSEAAKVACYSIFIFDIKRVVYIPHHPIFQVFYLSTRIKGIWEKCMSKLYHHLLTLE